MSLNVIAAPSPNFNDRKTPVSLIILHYTGMENGPVALERMCDRQAAVSAHYMVEEDGRVFQLVDESKRAWHAGVSYWRGERDINSASIGIEIVNGGHDFGLPAFAAPQIDAVVSLVRDLMQRHNLPEKAVIGHSDIAPDRKYDPGERFPWTRLAKAGCALAFTPAQAPVDDADTALSQIGYDPDHALVQRLAAFQRRFRPSRVDGVLDLETGRLLAAAITAFA